MNKSTRETVDECKGDCDGKNPCYLRCTIKRVKRNPPDEGWDVYITVNRNGYFTYNYCRPNYFKVGDCFDNEYLEHVKTVIMIIKRKDLNSNDAHT